MASRDENIKEIKNMLMWKNFPCLCIGRISTIKMDIAPKKEREKSANSMQSQIKYQWDPSQNQQASKQVSNLTNKKTKFTGNLKIHQSNHE